MDDKEKLRNLLARLIKLEGFAVTEVGNIKAAPKTIEKEEPDVILCDVKLPDGNGVDFIKEVKAKHFNYRNNFACCIWKYTRWHSGDEKRRFIINVTKSRLLITHKFAPINL